MPSGKRKLTTKGNSTEKPKQTDAEGSDKMAPASQPRIVGNAFAIEFKEVEGEKLGDTVAKSMLGPNIRHGHVAAVFAGNMLNGSGEAVSLMDAAAVIAQRASEAMKGDLSFASATLASQAIACDIMFSEFTRRAAYNLNENMDVVERFARLAMKAQSNCRATLETLAKLHQPREQTVRHININAGGQAVVTDQFHHHQERGLKNEKPDQCRASGARTASASPALPCPDPIGSDVSVASRKRKTSVPDARGHQPRRAHRKPSGA